jgi:hypothetical protein
MTTPEITPETPGQTLVAALSRQLPPQMEWDESELATLDLIEVATDRLAALRTVCDKAIADPESSATQIASLASEVRRTELAIHTLAKSLDPHNETAKSLRHVAAARSRAFIRPSPTCPARTSTSPFTSCRPTVSDADAGVRELGGECVA